MYPENSLYTHKTRNSEFLNSTSLRAKYVALLAHRMNFKDSRSGEVNTPTTHVNYSYSVRNRLLTFIGTKHT